MQVVLRDVPIDFHRDDVAQPLENPGESGWIAGGAGDFLPDLEPFLVARLAFPIERCLRAGGGFVDPDTQHMVAHYHRPIGQIVANVQQPPGIDETPSRGLDERPADRHVVNDALQLDFMHSKWS